MQIRLSRWYASALRVAVYCLTFVLPLAFFPWTFEPLEINKQTMLVIGVVCALFAWCGAMVVEKKMTIRKDVSLVFLAIFLLAVGVAAGTSVTPYSSLIGQAGGEYTSFLSYVALGCLLLIVAHTLTETAPQRVLWSLLIVSGAVVSLTTVPSLFTSSIFGTTLSLIGVPSALTMYLLALSVLGSGLWLSATDGGEHDVLPRGAWGVVVRGAHLLTIAVTLALLLVLDSTGLWIMALVGMGTLFAFAFVRAVEFPHFARFFLPMVVFVAALTFLFLPSIVTSHLPPEISPSAHASWQIARATLHDGHWFFGSGPGTFVADYTKHHAGAMNQTALWDERFDRANSQMFTLLPTVGVVGTVSYLLLLLAVGWSALRRLLYERVHDEWKMTFAPFAAWSVLVVGQFFLPLNMSLQFLFWLLSGVLVAQGVSKAVTYNAARSPRVGLAAAFGFVLMFVLLVTTLFVTLTRYSAEISFAAAIANDRAGAPLDDVLAALDQAALRNRWSDIYYRNLGHALLLKTAEALADPQADAARIQELIGASINAARRATSLAPDNVSNWELQGDIYREVMPIIDGADVYAVAAYEEAIASAPQNPKYRVALARTYIAQADRAAILLKSEDAGQVAAAQAMSTSALDHAVSALGEAQTLKGDYATARYYLASVYARQGKLSEAVASMETLRVAAPLDVGVAMQLSLLHLQQGKNTLAQAELERALAIEPNYANARWYLASIYQQAGDFADAIAQIHEVQKLNPDNAAVVQRLAQLEQGLADAQIPEPIDMTDGAGTESGLPSESSL